MQTNPAFEVSSTGMAAQAGSTFTYELTDCVECVGVGLADSTLARTLVPAEFQLLNDGQPVTPLVVLAVRYNGISIDGDTAQAGVVIQIGAMIAPPDGTGEINTYLLWHFTTHAKLARRLQHLGLNAQYVPTIGYDLSDLSAASTPDSTPGTAPSTAHIVIPRPVRPTLTFGGTISPPNQRISFVGNWWAKGNQGVLKMNSQVPEAMISDAQLTLTTEANSLLGQLIGGGSLGFAVLQRFNIFKLARTEVSLLRKEIGA